MGKIIGIDFGTNRIGIAISDSRKKIAFPRGILHRKKGSYCIGELKKILKDEKVEEFVIGIPLNNRKRTNAESNFLKELREYSLLLQQSFNKPVQFIDESYTTREALRSMFESGIKKKKRKKYSKNIDDVSAQLVLQRYLDQINSA